MEPTTETIALRSADSLSRVRVIQRCIIEQDKIIRSRFPVLNRQDALGLFFFLAPLIAICLVTSCYFWNILTWWQAVPLLAFPISILHEMEHDLIHNLYFRDAPWMQDLMFFVIWMCKLHGNPWYRRKLHLRHHQVSGQMNDLEERLIGLGLRANLKRLAVTMHPQGAAFVSQEIKNDCPDFDVRAMRLTSAPTMVVFFGITKLFILYIMQWAVFGGSHKAYYYLPLWGWPLIRDAMILWVAPNYLRQACLVLMSTSCHYYRDIPEQNLFYQNQILNHWLLTPFQLFCFNFASTHIIHHYLPTQPFYLRQLIAPQVQAEMIKQGVRHNDFGIILRANSYERPLESSRDYRRQELLGKLWFVAMLFGNVALVFFTDCALTAVVFMQYFEQAARFLGLTQHKQKHLKAA